MSSNGQLWQQQEKQEKQQEEYHHQQQQQLHNDMQNMQQAGSFCADAAAALDSWMLSETFACRFAPNYAFKLSDKCLKDGT
ncbi:hypothetical protein AWZ03_001092 [Drosophila navojoa]|uniref:Uncharacterized protein n=1 Tax=Drosophila navojoa TaxID=7232 RepID=A0A484BW81_DRONA|nr:hypothetical protein AWZ03_001092 [Drosophila navojoa]